MKPFDPAEPARRLEAGDFAGAAQAAAAGLARAPDDARLWTLYGVALAMGGRAAGAEAAFTRAAALAPADPEPLRNLATVRLSLSRHGPAVEAAQALARLLPADEAARTLLMQAQAALAAALTAGTQPRVDAVQSPADDAIP
jgi:Flp pilus assembly protein TadD